MLKGSVDPRVFFRGQTMRCVDVAPGLVGLTRQQVNALLHAGNSLKTLKELSELYIAKAEAEEFSEVDDA